tara:strand:+ start:260 stop:739 length:480 start_codon:yes stop_codon:yes gene_type:complete
MDIFEGVDSNSSVNDSDSSLSDRDRNPIPSYDVKEQDERISPLVLQTLSLIEYFRADIVCQFSNERPCGYLIRPQIWFLRITEPIKGHLGSIGVKPQKRYTKASDITKILHSIKQIESIIKNQRGLHLVKQLNGILRQPSTHNEVLKALDLIEQSPERL